MPARMMFLGTAVIAILCSCAQSSGGGAPGTEGTRSFAKPNLAGTWKSDCKPGSGGVAPLSTINFNSFSGSAMVAVGDNYAASDCSGDKVRSIKLNLTFDIPAKSALGPDVFDIDFVLHRISYIYHDQDAANAANTVAQCGFTDWVVGIEKDVTGNSCIANLKAGDPIYSVVKATQTQLYTGESDGIYTGKTPELRHARLAAAPSSRVE